MRLILPIGLALAAQAALADTVVATRTVRPNTVISAQDVRVDPVDTPGAYSVVQDVIGQEARIALYPGRPIQMGAVGAPALVDRNQLVALFFERGGLRIVTEGRALGRAAAGERIRVMNLSSKAVLFGIVLADGSVSVTP
ncbi:flagellar basal body P-ring formation protein FlgA [Thalassococcus sp. CAU 1522]|uniref:Flagella basal body P-ring formation protein FlgA n=1 Tax=Thalassococcus arenae TaxID=2851652 RepID=A0ABS6N5P3_9RHOB|nr:flagellar basal body P-ring formation chaperone FlgA [Thalassococcus arenae]MBV2359337.1 flagellar basal body P-ring formation protein FlgA [Thalassococcus arenae]